MLDHMMTLFPFEPAVFDRAGLASTFVGHPVVDGAAAAADGARFRAHWGIAPEAPLLCVMPGSREGEIRRLLPVFGETVAILTKRFPDLRAVVPTLPNLVTRVQGEVARWPIRTTVIDDPSLRFDAMAAAQAALAASGTVALELARCATPAVIAYRVHPLTARIVRWLITVRYVNLVNLLLDREAVPEFLQSACRANRLADALGPLMSDEAARAAQRAAYAEAVAMLSSGGMTPAEKAAETVLRVIGKHGGERLSGENESHAT